MTTHYGIEFTFLGCLREVEAELVKSRCARFGLLSLLALTGTRTLTAQWAVFLLLILGFIIVAVAVHIVVSLVSRGLRLVVGLVVVACQAVCAGIVLLTRVDVSDFSNLLVVGRVIHIVLHKQLADHAPIVLQHSQNDVLGSHVLLLHHARLELAELHRAVAITRQMLFVLVEGVGGTAIGRRHAVEVVARGVVETLLDIHTQTNKIDAMAQQRLDPTSLAVTKDTQHQMLGLDEGAVETLGFPLAELQYLLNARVEFVCHFRCQK